jgi:hypothetical protein
MSAADSNPGERVTRGIGLLPPVLPAWWADGPQAIDLGTIDFLDLERGTLAQLFGGHEKGCRLLHIPKELAPEFGFAALNADDNVQLKRIVRVIVNSFRAEAASPNPPR